MRLFVAVSVKGAINNVRPPVLNFYPLFSLFYVHWTGPHKELWEFVGVRNMIQHDKQKQKRLSCFTQNNLVFMLD